MRINRWICTLAGTVFLVSVSALLLVPAIAPPQVFADGPDSEYFSVRTVALDGRSIDEVIINGPPTPPPGFERVTVELPEPNIAAGLNTLANVPAFSWCFGCSATSAAMIAGYYDRTGYGNMYAGPTNSGVMPLDNSSWGTWEDSNSDTRAQCPLSATRNGVDGRATKGHVDDYWDYYGQPGPDPWDGIWTEHTPGECTGDFMNTNQWVYPSGSFNTVGSTTFYYYTDGALTPTDDLEAAGIPYSYDGGYGFELFYESRGYTVDTAYNQYIYGYDGNTLGFTYAQYKAEIDAGRPVMIHLEGHTIVGLGYDDTSSDLMYIHDTWDYSTHDMIWGGTYSLMQHLGVTVIQLQSPGAQTWYLSDTIADSNYFMYRGDTAQTTGTVEIANLAQLKWRANEAASGDVTFPAGDWDVLLHFDPAPDNNDDFSGKIGMFDYWGSNGDWESPDVDWKGDGTTQDFQATLSLGSFTVDDGKHLWFTIINMNNTGPPSLQLKVGSTYSVVISPTTDPGYPIPELATIILFGSGLICLGGYLIVKRRAKSYQRA